MHLDESDEKKQYDAQMKEYDLQAIMCLIIAHIVDCAVTVKIENNLPGVNMKQLIAMTAGIKIDTSDLLWYKKCYEYLFSLKTSFAKSVKLLQC